MGTQFSSRLTRSDASKVLGSLRRVRREYVRAKKGEPRIADAGRLPAPRRRQMADEVVGEVLKVAESRQFLNALVESDLFVTVLDWLKELRSDADFRGFAFSIEKYKLEESPLPTKGLIEALRDITHAAWEDPFRVSISNAARGILAEAADRPVPPKQNETDAKRFGRQFATFTLKELVDRFVSLFLGDAVARIVSRASPAAGDATIREAQVLAQSWAERAAKRVAKRVEREGKLQDSKRVREIVFEDLTKFVVARAA